MFQLLPVFIPILLADVINPVLLAAVIYALGSKKPIYYSIMVLVGWLTVYFGSGILLALGFEAMMEFLNNPRPVDFYIEIVITVLLIYNLLYILPFLIIIGIRLVSGEKSDNLLQTINNWIKLGKYCYRV